MILDAWEAVARMVGLVQPPPKPIVPHQFDPRPLECRSFGCVGKPDENCHYCDRPMGDLHAPAY